MNKTKKIIFMITGVFAVGLLGCATGSYKKDQIQMRPVEEVVLDNGLRILFVQDDSLPRLGLSLMIKTGSAYESEKQRGLNALTARALDQGTSKRTALEVSEFFGQLGTEFSASPDQEVTYFTASTLSSKASELLSIYSEVILSPRFETSQVSRIKNETLAGLKKQADNPSAFASTAFMQFLFERQHPYGAPVSGFQKTVGAFSRKDILDFYQKNYLPNNSILAVYGKLPPSYRQAVRLAFSSWKKGTVPVVSIAKSKAADSRKVVIVNKPGLKQAQIRIGQLGPERTDKRFFALRLGNMAFGGAFASRLNQKIRDDLGLTYSVSSGFSHFKEGGLFQISTFTRYDKMTETISAAEKELNKFSSDGITAKELAAAKAVLIGQFPLAIETVDQYVYNLMILRFYEIPDTYLTNYIENVEKVSLTEVNEAIRAVLKPATQKILVYGDQEAMSQSYEIWPNLEIKTYKDFQ